LENSEWRGSPLDMGSEIDPYGIREVVIQFENGDTDTFRPKQRDEYQSYELHQVAAYLASMSHSIRKGQKK
jgi:hypothetical protein